VVACHDGYVFVSVGGYAPDGDEHALFRGFARIAFEADDVLVRVAYHLKGLYLFQKT
jgi:hypothetical protein